MTAHDFIQVPLIQAFISTQNVNILCLFEIFFDSMIDLNNGKISINGYSIFKAISINSDPTSSKRRGVCIYFKQSLSLFRRHDISAMQESTVGADF